LEQTSAGNTEVKGIREVDVINIFHWMFYNRNNTWQKATWMGVPCYQNPLDMWVTQEIINETEPTYIIETGSGKGGSALFYVSTNPKVHVISIDKQDNINMVPVFNHDRVWWKVGRSTDPDIVEEVKRSIKPSDKVMVVLDSDHTVENVLAEMRIYSPMVTRGCYMIINDTNLGGNPVESKYCPVPGPMGAVVEFMKENQDFEIDKTRERFMVTFFPNGWLKRK
jgi:cephalosporin hydroxylase